MIKTINQWVGTTLSTLFAAVFLTPSAQAAGPNGTNEKQTFPVLQKEPGNQKKRSFTSRHMIKGQGGTLRYRAGEVRTGAARAELRRVLVLAACVLGVGVGRNVLCAEVGGRVWSTADSIAVKYYGDPVGDWDGNPKRPAAVPSPDGHYFYVMSSRGELGCECVVQTLEVFDTQQVRRFIAVGKADPLAPLTPLHTLEFRTRDASGSAMREIRWSQTGTAIEFIARDADVTGAPVVPGASQVYRFELPSGRLQALTSDTSRKDVFFLQGDTVLYRRSVPQGPAEPSPHLIVAAPRNAAGDIELLVWRLPYRLEWVTFQRGGESWVLPNVSGVGVLQAWFSPDGRRAVIVPGSPSGIPQQFMLADFARQQVRALSEVAVGGQTRTVTPTSAQAFWTADGKQAIVVNTALPAGQAPSLKQPADAGYVAAYDVESGRWQVLEALNKSGTSVQQVRALGWLKNGSELLITRGAGGQPADGTVYARQGDRWVGRSVASRALPPAKVATLPSGLTVTVRQSANDPPVLVAAEGSHERVLSKADPALQGVWRSRLEPFTWSLPDWQSVTGGLSLPRSAPDGTRTPLVIQAGEYSPDVFLPDGSIPAGFARQALVGHGIVVLQMSTRDLPGLGTPREGAEFVARLDAAVEALARQGTIDPKRVGLVGHSRTGYQTYYAVTHPGRVHLAAVEVWDATTLSYPQYLEAAVIGRFRNGPERVNGGPFWQNKASWLERDVLFNVDRAEAATLFVDHGGNGLSRQTADEMFTTALMTMGAFQLNRRPVDFLFIPSGSHILPGVRERKPAMDLTVDWMRFWLQEREDPSADKAEQYARWRLIRQRNEERKNEERRMTQEDGVKAAPPAASAAPIVHDVSARETELRQVREEMKANGVADVASDVNALNTLGYRALYEANDVKKALMYFHWNLVLFPKHAAQTEDSLAEGYLQAGDRERAIEHYKTVVKLNPTLKSKAAAIVARLQSDSNGLSVLQEEARQGYHKEMARQQPPK